MPFSVTCPTCDARLKAPDGSAGLTFRCPRCTSPVVVPATPGPATHFAFDSGAGIAGDNQNPFEDDSPADDPTEMDAEAPRMTRRATPKKKRAAGYNPFDEDAGGEAPTAGSPPRKRRYRKDGDYNPFGELPQEEALDPVGEGFEFGLEAPPPAPTGEFDFGPLDPRGDDEDGRRRRRR